MDDDETVRSVLGTMLSLQGHQVILAEDGQEAVDIYRNCLQGATPIDVTIMDLTVPGRMGGAEAATHITTIDPQALLIASSGYSNDPIMAQSRNYGFFSSIAKPFQSGELNSVIQDSLKEQQRRKNIRRETSGART